jgi:putative tryptophan/tyrosine transport system substrate-binding protein
VTQTLMNQKIFALALSAALFTLCSVAWAQQEKKVFRIGFLGSGSVSSMASRTQSFQQGLRELGYVESQNIIIDYRFAEGSDNRLPALSAELLRLNPDVLITSGSPGTRALMKATHSIPIVMAAIGDAVGSGFVKSLAQPGGNVTGLSFLDPDITTKRLEILKESLPRVGRVAVLRYAGSGTQSLDATLATARLLKLQIQMFEIRAAGELDGTFIAAKKFGAEAISVLASAILFAHRTRLVELAAHHRLPGIYENKEFPEAGGLMSYGANIDDLFRRAATYVDKILKGARPADLPVEQPTKFEFIINLKAAKQIGVTIPPNVLARADRVIK